MFDNFELLPNPSNFNVFKVRVRKTIHRSRPHNVELVDHDLVYKGFNVVKDHFLLQPKPFNFENFENRLVGQLRPRVPWVSGLPHPSNQQQPPTLKTLRTVSSEHNVGTKTPSHPTVLEGEH